eukprot:TRINITY_DN52456_c0_g1_i1.p1 TRINITY_DN52456_c0_g1~~TRINITY_DN52456_c0_g1_i1.p1  ORF type:complete len:165 (-),score=29.68 TRINITY_DN52456_c0_g1_i1:41-487(-)
MASESPLEYLAIAIAAGCIAALAAACCWLRRRAGRAPLLQDPKPVEDSEDPTPVADDPEAPADDRETVAEDREVPTNVEVQEEIQLEVLAEPEVSSPSASPKAPSLPARKSSAWSMRSMRESTGGLSQYIETWELTMSCGVPAANVKL